MESDGKTSYRLAKLRVDLRELNRGKRELVGADKKKWQCVPWLAALADGRTGWSEQHGRACRYLEWSLKSDGTGASVDLLKAKILPLSKGGKEAPVITAIKLDDLDVDRILEALLVSCNASIFSGYDKEELRQTQFMYLQGLHRQYQPLHGIARQQVMKEFPNFPHDDSKFATASLENLKKVSF